MFSVRGDQTMKTTQRKIVGHYDSQRRAFLYGYRQGSRFIILSQVSL